MNLATRIAAQINLLEAERLCVLEDLKVKSSKRLYTRLVMIWRERRELSKYVGKNVVQSEKQIR